MSDYLEDIEQEILARKEAQAVAVREETPAAPVVTIERPAGIEAAGDTTSRLVEGAFNQAVAHRVATDEGMQQTLLESADRVIRNKTDAIQERAEMEDKAAYFRNKKGACECFGYNEETTEKWAVKVMHIWHNIMTAIWLCVGFITFAPITFVAKKITVIFKKSWVAITISIIIYLLVVVGGPFLAAYLTK